MRHPALIAATLFALAMLPVMAQQAQDIPPGGIPQQAPPPYSDPNAPPPPDQQGAPDQQPYPPQQYAPQQYAPDQGGQPGPGAPPPGAPDQSANFQTFYDNLGQQGTWIQSPDYGYIWQPNISDPNWAPYTVGNWAYSDAGWVWVSAEPFGWATYHYGRWVNLTNTGWCWVPGYTWAPAWVSWRYGGGYCGWAPLPPDSFVGIDYIGAGIQISVGFHIGGDCDSYYGIGAGWYHFVPVNYMGYPNYRGHYLPPNQNFTVINHTTNVTNINVASGAPNSGPRTFNSVSTGGPSLAQVNAVSATPVPHVRLTSASQPGGGGRVSNNTLAVYAPHVAPTTNQALQPAHVAGTIQSSAVNRGVDVTQPLAVNRNIAPAMPTGSQIQKAQLAQYSAPPGAKIATPQTQVASVAQGPITSMNAIPAVHAATVQPNLSQGSNYSQFHGGATVTPNNTSTAHVQPTVPQSGPYSQSGATVTPNNTSTAHVQPYVPQSGPYSQSGATVTPGYGNTVHVQTTVTQSGPYSHSGSTVTSSTSSTPVVHTYQQASQVQSTPQSGNSQSSSQGGNPYYQQQQQQYTPNGSYNNGGYHGGGNPYGGGNQYQNRQQQQQGH